MSKIILGFLFIFTCVFFGIQIVRDLNKSEKLGLTKLLAYSIVCTVITMVVITSIVLVF
jgi:hypothetical protein